MKPDISEFSYGFALTSELIDQYSLRSAGAPEFPSLYKEGKAGGGYDVKLPAIPLFLQFKLSDCMVRYSAQYANLLKVPYYRMHLRPLRHSAQHDLLLALEQQEGNLVYYAAPEFHKPYELSLAYTTRSVRLKSAFFAPSAIGVLDEEDHYIAFVSGADHGYLCSEPRRIPRSAPEDIFVGKIRQNFREGRARPMGADFFREIGDKLVGIFERRPIFRREERQVSEEQYKVSYQEAEERQQLTDVLHRIREEREPREYARYVSQTLFDLEILIAVQERK